MIIRNYIALYNIYDAILMTKILYKQEKYIVVVVGN